MATGKNGAIANEITVSPALVSILADMVETVLRAKPTSGVASEANEDASEEQGP